MLVIANKADTLLSNKGLTNGVAKVSIQDPMELSALVLPAEMSSPERLAKDLSLSAEVGHGLFGRSRCSQNELVMSHENFMDSKT